MKEQVVLKDTTDKKNDEVKYERSQWREKPIIIRRKEIKDNEKEIEGEKQKEKEENEKLGRRRERRVTLTGEGEGERNQKAFF